VVAGGRVSTRVAENLLLQLGGALGRECLTRTGIEALLDQFAYALPGLFFLVGTDQFCRATGRCSGWSASTPYTDHSLATSAFSSST